MMVGRLHPEMDNIAWEDRPCLKIQKHGSTCFECKKDNEYTAAGRKGKDTNRKCSSSFIVTSKRHD